jgi:hypothetical protein
MESKPVRTHSVLILLAAAAGYNVRTQPQQLLVSLTGCMFHGAVNLCNDTRV